MSSSRNSSSYDNFDRQNTNNRQISNTRSPTPNHSHNEHYYRNPKISSTSVIPHRNTSDSPFPSSYQKNQSPAINQIADNLEAVFQVALLDKTM